jgi:hypothetical protein
MVHPITDPTVDPLSTASSCYLYVDDVDSVYRSWQAAWPELSFEEQAAGARLGPPEDTAYGMGEWGRRPERQPHPRRRRRSAKLGRVPPERC